MWNEQQSFGEIEYIKNIIQEIANKLKCIRNWITRRMGELKRAQSVPSLFSSLRDPSLRFLNIPECMKELQMAAEYIERYLYDLRRLSDTLRNASEALHDTVSSSSGCCCTNPDAFSAMAYRYSAAAEETARMGRTVSGICRRLDSVQHSDTISFRQASEEMDDDFRHLVEMLERSAAKMKEAADKYRQIDASPEAPFMMDASPEAPSAIAADPFPNFSPSDWQSEIISAMPPDAPSPEAETPNLKKVQFSAVVPRQALKDDYMLLSLFMYEEAFRHVVDECIAEADAPVRETRGSVMRIREGSAVKVVLSSPDLPVEDGEEVQQWQGDYLNFSFSVFIPAEYIKKKILFNAAVYINDLLCTRLKFTAECVTAVSQKISVIRKDVLSAFMSYASQDRSRVASILQGMTKILPDLDMFFDVESLRSGDDWAKRLQQEIEVRDILFLFWSRHARDSEWVNREWRYALERKGPDSIEPVPIESPALCPPPKELEQKHFNDKLLYIIDKEQE